MDTLDLWQNRTAIVCGLLCVLLLAKVTQLVSINPLCKVPGPRHASWTDLPLKFKILQGQRSQYIHSLHQKYGHFVRISPTEVSISDINAFRTIHKSGGGFKKAEWYLKFTQSRDPGIFAMTDPLAHSIRRRLFANPFANSSILKYEDSIRAKAELALEKIGRDAATGGADILKWFTFMATDLMGQLSFGTSFEMLRKEKKDVYIRDLETAMMLSGIKVELSLLTSIIFRLPFGPWQGASQLRIRLDEYGYRAVQNYKAYMSSETSDSSTRSLLYQFLDQDKNSELNDIAISEEASNLIIAGSDTTAVTLTYLVWAILKPQNRHVRKRLMEELDPLPSGLSSHEIAALPYLDSVLQESLRLYGAAPGSLPRTVPVGGITLGGYYLPEDTIVSTQGYTLHRDPSIFEDPESFLPERWERPSGEMKQAFCPFGVGARTCLGIHLALLELRLSAFLFFKRYPKAELDPSTTESSMEFENYFLITPKSHQCNIIINTN